MACVCCFFDNQFRKGLKQNCFGNAIFSEKLQQYREVFLAGLRRLGPITECSCPFSRKNSNNAVFIDFTNAMLFDFQNKENLISDIFDNLIEIYSSYVSKNIESSNERIAMFMEQYIYFKKNIENSALGSFARILTAEAKEPKLQ